MVPVTRLFFLVCLLVCGFQPNGWGQIGLASKVSTPLSEREKVVHVLGRLGFGHSPESFQNALDMGAEAWITRQLESEIELSPTLTGVLGQFETLDLTPKECREFIYMEIPDDATPEERRARNALRNLPKRELAQSVLLRAMLNERQIEEVLCDFWRNHFNVSFTKGGPADALIPDYESQVIRGNIWGKFPAMLKDSARHPAMLHYLDNYLSRKPPSKQELAEVERKVRRRTGSRQRGEEAASIAAQKGLNENYARELLELHTLGVDKFYKQKDVVAVAEALTGWTADLGRNGTQNFVFNGGMHIYGDKRVLGRVIRSKAGEGQEEGEAILNLLSSHRGTADFVATKLVRYFVNDIPPPALVRRVSATFSKTKGSIPEMISAIVESKEFWARENYRAKFKTPFEFVVSALRVTGAEVDSVRKITSTLQSMGQPTLHCDDPTGWYDTAESWLDPGVMALRWEFAEALASGKVEGVRIPDSFFSIIPSDLPPLLWQHHLTRAVLPGGAGERTRAALAAVTNDYLKGRSIPDLYDLGPRLLGLLLGSPEFQQQ